MTKLLAPSAASLSRDGRKSGPTTRKPVGTDDRFFIDALEEPGRHRTSAIIRMISNASGEPIRTAQKMRSNIASRIDATTFLTHLEVIA
jgi:hypothetical protein